MEELDMIVKGKTIFKKTHNPSKPNHHRCIPWTKPPVGTFKINFDGVKDNFSKATTGFCIQNHEDQLIRAEALNCGRNSIIVSEELGLRMRIREAKKMGLQNVHVEGDNLCVIKSLKEYWSTPWEIKQIVADVSHDLRSFTHTKVAHCYRETNKAADFMAKFRLSCINAIIGFDCTPPLIYSILVSDGLGLGM